MKLAQHVLGVHRDASEAAAAMSHSRSESDPTPTADGGDDGTDENGFNLKRYIQFCRARVSPRLNENAAAALGREYVKIREDQRTRNQQRASTEGANPVPITVRQLEAIVRVSESLARMTMHTEVRCLYTHRRSTARECCVSSQGNTDTTPIEVHVRLLGCC